MPCASAGPHCPWGESRINQAVEDRGCGGINGEVGAGDEVGFGEGEAFAAVSERAGEIAAGVGGGELGVTGEEVGGVAGDDGPGGAAAVPPLSRPGGTTPAGPEAQKPKPDPPSRSRYSAETKIEPNGETGTARPRLSIQYSAIPMPT